MKHILLTESQIEEIKEGFKQENAEFPEVLDGYVCLGHCYETGFNEDDHDTLWRSWVFYKTNKEEDTYTTVILHDDGNQWASFVSANDINETIDSLVKSNNFCNLD